jgi:hypothetical protein
LEEEKQSRKLRGNLLQIPAARQKITPMRTGKSGKIFLVDARRAITRDKPKFPVRSGSFRFVPVRSGSFRFVPARSGSFRLVPARFARRFWCHDPIFNTVLCCVFTKKSDQQILLKWGCITPRFRRFAAVFRSSIFYFITITQ